MVQWADNNTFSFVENDNYQWEFTTSSGVYLSKIYIDNTYVYSSINNILNIYLVESNASIITVTYAFDITSLYSNNDYLFIGTYTDGVKYFNTSILESEPSSETIYNNTFSYKLYPDITSNHIKHISGANNYVSFCTIEGIDFFKLEPNGYRSYATSPNIYNSFVLSERELFFTVSGTVGWEIYKKDPIVNWEITNSIVDSSSSALAYVTVVKELKVSKTSQRGTTLFFLTDIGICVYTINNNEFFYID